MKHKDDSLEWHDENELVRKLDVVEAVLNLADTIDDVIDVIMSVPNTDAPYIDIETGILHWHGWKYRRIVDCRSTADIPQTDCSEKPNNCEYVENPSGDAWECGCFLDTYCEHQIYDRNPDGTINIVECGYEPKDEPQTERSSE